MNDAFLLYFETWFTYRAHKNAYLRITERSPKPSPSSVQLRNITVSERLGARP